METIFVNFSKEYIHKPSLEEEARKIVGDGKTPNKFFVSISNSIQYIKDGEIETEPYSGIQYKAAMLESFDDIDEVKQYVNDIDLGFYEIGSVIVEDRLDGTVYERTLTKKISISYEEEQYGTLK